MENLIKPKSYHSISVEKSFEHLKSSREGLTEFEALGRIEKLGKNMLPIGKKFSQLRIFLSQFNSPLMFIISGAAIASFFVGHLADSLFIVFVILINTIVGFIQENKAEKALEKLKKSVKFYCRVIREGNKKEILSENVAIGDIVEINAGDKVPADGRIIDSQGLKINEANLTGEWIGVEKDNQAIDENTDANEMSDMAFLGSVVEEGNGLMVVTSTGINTELGKISKLVKEEKETKAPIQKKFAHLSLLMGVAIVAIVAIFAVINIIQGENFQNVFITSIALVVSAIPEGLLPAITVVMILGMRRISRQKALVRKLNSSETMGAVTVICMDKTGTLTQGKMQVSHVLTGEKELLHHEGELNDIYKTDKFELHAKVLEVVSLLSEAYIENPKSEFSEWIVRGRPTDKALLLAGINAGIEKDILEDTYKLIGRIPFSSERKYAVNIYETDKNEKVLYFLGSPEETLRRSKKITVDGISIPLTSKKGKGLIARNEELTKKGLRVLACGWKKVSNDEIDQILNHEEVGDINLLGFIALKDPLRHDVNKSVDIAKKAGIRPIIVTGDHKNTARSIMEELGIRVNDDDIMEGKNLDEISDSELERKVRTVSIFARVMPVHKIRIVRALQSQNEIVAMVGDGVNDAPAIKAADVGIAVGSGTDITKEVSDIILLDNSFSVIIKAIEQGRLIFQNIRRVLIYLLADDFSELFLFFSAIALGMPFPMYPIQILWINLVEDGFPNTALTTEKDTEGIMDQKPRDPKEPILSRAYKKFMFSVFFVSGMAALITFYFSLEYYGDIEKVRTLIFTLIAFDSLTFAYSIRSFKKSIFNRNILSNNILNGAILISFALLLAGIYFEPLQKLLRTVSLGISEWGIVIGVSIVELLMLEVLKKRFFAKEKR